jgi:hypothetical protein
VHTPGDLEGKRHLLLGRERPRNGDGAFERLERRGGDGDLARLGRASGRDGLGGSTAGAG